MKLKWAEMISPSVRHFACEINDGEPFQFTAGQFINVHFNNGNQPFRRSYSIASSPNNKLIELAAGYVDGGPGTKYLFSLKPDDTITTSGPFGRLILRDESPKRYILAATSTGVTPFRSMIPQLEKLICDTEIQVTLLLGVRTRQELIYGHEFIDFANKHPNFLFRAQFSREDIKNPQSYEHEGYVQTTFKELEPNPQNDIVYLCGNPYMIDDAYLQLKALGFDVKNVRREKYVSAK